MAPQFSISSEPTLSAPDGETVEYRGWQLPPGLIGEIAYFIYCAAPKPLQEVALAGAIAYFAGIVGRAYNVQGMGLNQYVVLLADTGAGKNAAKTGIDKLNTALEPLLQFGLTVRKGLGHIPSPQGLLKSLAGDGKDPNTSRLCCVSVLGEVGLWLQEICDKRADSNRTALRRLLLDLYTASGGSKRCGDIGYSDTLKNVKEFIAPAFSFLGESTQHAFYKAVTEDSVAEGFLTRITLIEYPLHKLPEPNHTHNAAQPSPELLYRLGGLLRRVIDVERQADSTHTYNWIDVPLDDASTEYSAALECYCRRKMETYNSNGESHLSSIWTRVQEKTLRIAALIAVGIDPDNPRITLAEMTWAQNLVMHGTDILIQRFQSGHVGENNSHMEQHDLLLGCLKRYIEIGWTAQFEKNYGVSEALKSAGIVHYRYIYNILHKRPAFKNAHNTSMALDNIIKEFVSTDYLQEVGRASAVRGNRTGKMWLIKIGNKLVDKPA
jgi:hypothetical protein